MANISFAVTWQLICAFVLAYAERQFFMTLLIKELSTQSSIHLCSLRLQFSWNYSNFKFWALIVTVPNHFFIKGIQSNGKMVLVVINFIFIINLFQGANDFSHGAIREKLFASDFLLCSYFIRPSARFTGYILPPLTAYRIWISFLKYELWPWNFILQFQASPVYQEKIQLAASTGLDQLANLHSVALRYLVALQ